MRPALSAGATALHRRPKSGEGGSVLRYISTAAWHRVLLQLHHERRCPTWGTAALRAATRGAGQLPAASAMFHRLCGTRTKGGVTACSMGPRSLDAVRQITTHPPFIYVMCVPLQDILETTENLGDLRKSSETTRGEWTTHIRRYFGPLPPSLAVHRGPITSVALQSMQLAGLTTSLPSTRS
jgi:hypothetical protein